ncbi:MAG: MFS transporter [Micropruina sp.]|uniref:MFS transporter n=1 Tax=Micropruina sp. TaxID=2737536 RepID=UPI0039E4E019
MTRTAAPVDPRRLVAAHALAAVAVALPWPALLAAIWRIAADPALVGLAGASRFAPCVLLSAFLGGLGDRIGRLRAVRLSIAARVLLVASVAALLLGDLPWPALVAATLSVAVGVPAFPSLAALIPQLSARPDHHTNALVTWEISAFVVGPALGGMLLAAAPAWSVAVSVPLIVAALVVLPRRVPERAPSVHRPRLWDGWRAVLAVRVVRRAIVAVMTLNVVIGVLGVALLTIAETRWEAGVAAFGWLTAAQGFASLTAPVLARMVGRLSPGIAAHLVVVLPLVVVTVSPGWLAAAVPMALLGSGLTMVECRTTRMMQLGAPADYTAVALGLADSAVVAAALAGALVAPWLLAVLGPVGLLAGLAVACSAVLAWGLS